MAKHVNLRLIKARLGPHARASGAGLDGVRPPDPVGAVGGILGEHGVDPYEVARVFGRVVARCQMPADEEGGDIGLRGGDARGGVGGRLVEQAGGLDRAGKASEGARGFRNVPSRLRLTSRWPTSPTRRWT